jgi:phosphoadenosine phosphosulfate reductase
MSEQTILEQAARADFLPTANDRLIGLRAEDRIAWALDHLPGRHLLSSSFGVQAAVMLHLVTRVDPRMPVIFIDTGYLLPETYRFVDELTGRLALNLPVYRSGLSPAWLEARHGRLWENGVQGIEHFNRISRIEPMRRALAELGAGTWLAGLRREQSRTRGDLPVLASKDGRYKLHPIIDWCDADMDRYLERHRLPHHPLSEQGYVSVGDRHTSQPLAPGMRPEQTRFFGVERECGLHE